MTMHGLIRLALLAAASLSFTNIHALSLDPTFGSGGRVVLDKDSVNAYQALLQPDGRIVVVATSYATFPADGLVIRFNADGTLDASFGQNGIVTIPQSMGTYAQALARQADGKLLVGGSSPRNANLRHDLLLARLNVDGSVDSSFGSNGAVTVDFSDMPVFIPGEGDTDEYMHSIVVQSDGAIIAGGSTFGFVTAAGAAARFLPDGQLDVSYGSGGRIAQYFSGHGTDGVPYAYALTSDEKLVLVGTRGRPATPDVRLFDQAGGRDSTFGNNGAVYPRADDYVRAYTELALLVQPDNKLVVSARVGASATTPAQGLVARINTDGSLDSSFGNGGYITLQQSTGIDVRAMAAEPSGKILVAGTLARSNDPNVSDAFLSRLIPSGYDTSFGTTVINANDAGTAFDFAPISVLRATDGKVIVVGTRGANGGVVDASNRLVLVRLLSSPEITFQGSQAQASANRGSINLTIRRIGDPNSPVSIDYSTENGTAVAGVDYTSTSGTLTWAAGEPESKLITIPISDNGSQSTRQFTVKLSKPNEGYVSGNTMTVSITPRTESPRRNGGGGGSFNWLMLFALGALARSRRMF